VIQNAIDNRFFRAFIFETAFIPSGSSASQHQALAEYSIVRRASDIQATHHIRFDATSNVERSQHEVKFYQAVN